ncbi:hypothetical protein CRG98_002992 [Punica granatum]|uniref:GAG-pre-integrase domain-containing protein n=1 Tax=Punica granatum TaxID=22663 RepID=A0A2I0L7R8_PUNGR|nr:hypothetical protein CRG98_002992 [Punica granatum]
MENLLLCSDLYDPIEGDSAKPKDKDDKAWECANRKTIDLIRQWIDNSIYHHVAQETNAKALWENLTNLYTRKTPQNKVFLVEKLVHLRYQDGSDMAVHMSNFQDIVNQLTNLEIILPNELQACLLLGTLSDNCDTLVVALSNYAPNGRLSLAMVTNSLFNEETRKKGSGIFIRSEALVTEQRGRSQSRNSSSKHGNSCDKSWEGREGRALKRNQNGNGESKKEYGTTAVASDGETYIVCDEAYVNLTCQDSTWVADTEIELGCKLLLKKVRHVLEIRLKPISTGRFDDESYNNEFSSRRWKLFKIVARCQKTDTLYRLRVMHNSGQVNVADDYPIELWHMRLGHISEKCIQILARKQSLPVKAVERETDMKLKCVRADNGGEYRGPFENHCRTHRIKLEKTAKLSKFFWGEAMRTAIDLINLTPSVALDGDVPQQDPDSRKIIRSRDVVFFEDQIIEDLQKLEKAEESSPHEISIPVPVDVEHRVEEVLGEDEETMTGGEIPQVDDDVIKDDTNSQLQLEPADNLPRRSNRVRQPFTRYPPHEYVLLTDGEEPECYDEVVAHEHKEYWLKAMNEEMNSLSENHTYDLVKLPQEGAISWKSRLQKFIALSTKEAKYIAVTEGCKEMLWLQKFL